MTILSNIKLDILYLLQTRVINYVSKDISEMLPRWDNDEPDVPAKNIVNVMFGAIGSGPKNDVQSKVLTRGLIRRFCI